MLGHVIRHTATCFTGDSVIPISALEDLKARILKIGNHIYPEAQDWPNIDEMWTGLCKVDRRYGSLVYNAVKLLPETQVLGTYVTRFLVDHGFFKLAAITDINFRIDAPNELKYLFGWHQDYWFGMASSKAYVGWLPVTGTDDQIGGVDILDMKQPLDLLRTKKGDQYNSYADAIVLDQQLPEGNVIQPEVAPGNVLFFSYMDLHRSRPNMSTDRCRWTIQVRMVDLADPEFLKAEYRPTTVNENSIPFLRENEHSYSV